MLTIKEAAAALDGCEIGQEGSAELFEQMQAAGLVAVFGASDDLMEFRGAIHDEEYVSTDWGGSVWVTSKGLVKFEDCDCAAAARERKWLKVGAYQIDVDPHAAARIKATWAYRADMPIEEFHVLEDGELYCRGFVFRLEDMA